MTSKLTITREQATDKEIQMLIDSHENGTAMFLRVDAYYLMAKELQERRKAAMDSESVAVPDHLTYLQNPTLENVLSDDEENSPMAHAARILAREVKFWRSAPLYLHAQPAPVVPDAYVRDERGRMMLNGVCEPKIGFGTGWNACRAAMLQAVPITNEVETILHNYRTAMEGIGHIRRTLEETFGGLHGTHVEPDVLAECKAICDAIYAAYRHAQPAPVIPDRSIFEKWWESQNGAPLDGWDSLRTTDGYCDDGIDWQFEAWNAAMLAAAPQEVKGD